MPVPITQPARKCRRLRLIPARLSNANFYIDVHFSEIVCLKSKPYIRFRINPISARATLLA
jgi:hypothetical protein